MNNNDPVFCTLLFKGPYFGLDFFKVPDPKKISGRSDKLEKWGQIDWTSMLVLNVSNNGCFCAVVIQAGHTILAFSPQMESCGVSQCENGGELWMCVTIRFPMLPGSVFFYRID